MLNFFKKTKTDSVPLFIPTGFNLHSLKTLIESNIDLLKNSIHKCNITANELTLDYNITENKDIIQSTRLRFLKNDTIIYVFEEAVSLTTNDYSEVVSPSKSALEKNGIFNSLQHHILTLQNDNLYALENTCELPFVQQTDSITKNYIFQQLLTGEYILSVLGISSVSFNEEQDFPKDSLWYFILTSNRVLLIANSNNNLQTIDLSNECLELIEKTGKDRIEAESLSFYTEYMNDPQYVALFPAVETKINRLSVFTDCFLKNTNAKAKYLELASRCYAMAYQQHSKPIDNLKSICISHLKAFQIKEETFNNLLSVLKPISLDQSTFGHNLIQIITDWNIDYKEQNKLFKILIQLQDEVSVKNSIAFYKYFNSIFSEKETKEETLFEFNFTYGKLLAKAKQYTEAIAVYNRVYKTLPDDSITDLLPANTTNILQGEGGQQLKITLLESILDWEQKQQLNSNNTYLKLAQLQPLLQHRLESLKENHITEQKAIDIEHILKFSNKEYTQKSPSNKKYERLIKSEILDEVVPECFKHATGFFDSLNGYIASIQSPNYDAVISFSDKLTASNYPDIYKHITRICYALSIDTPECYIGRADYSNAIIGVEGSPPFLIIGIDFIDAQSRKKLNSNELKFLAAIELAHIYFDHSKITATDVWRGAAEKGFSLLTTVLSIIPFAGSVGNILGNFSNIDKYAKIIKGVEKATNIAEKGQNILDVSEKLNINLINKENSKDRQSQNLLITSRLMEIIADRVALLFCNDLQAAVRGIVLSSSLLDKSIDNIEEFGLYNVLKRTNDQGDFYYQEAIIRIRSLCAFYLSDTFEVLKAKLHED